MPPLPGKLDYEICHSPCVFYQIITLIITNIVDFFSFNIASFKNQCAPEKEQARPNVTGYSR